jgi:transcriptional regulator with XRE-family HTH domain
MIKKKPKATKVDVTIGKNLRKWRKAKNMTAVKLSECLDIHHSQLKKYEDGVNRISAANLWKVSNFLRIRVDFFFQDNDSSTDENIALIHKLSLLRKSDKKYVIDMINGLLEQP